MNDIGFPAQPRQNAISRQITTLRAQINATSDEAITGRLSDVAVTRGGRVAEVFEAEKALADLSRYRQIIGQSETRAGLVQTSLGRVHALSVSVTNTAEVTLAAQGQTPLEVVSKEARESLTAAIAALETSYGGRSLFAGDAGDQGALVDIDSFLAATTPILEAAPDAATALANLDAAFSTPGGLFEATLYTGGTSNAPSTEIAPGERVDYAIRADDPAIREVLKNLAVLAAAFDETNAIDAGLRRDLGDLATDRLRNAADGITTLSAQVGTAEQRIADIKARNIAEETALTRSFNDLTGRDQFEAIAELESLEGQLESLFLTTARLSNLSLLNFLR